MNRWLWQLLPLLLGLRVSTEAPDCSNANQTVTVQLSRIHVLRTWQPDGAHCRWWETRRSETNQFPAAVRSGPRWLVMQLKQQMRLEEVNVRGWDGQWQAAAPVGSPVSALGASNLPLELQLQDPCRAPLEAFNNSDRWRQLEGQPVSFILLASAQPLQWSSLSLTGRIVPMELNETRNPFCLNCEPLTWRPGDTIGFSVSSCGSQPPNCWVRMADGRLNKAAMLASRQGADSSRITHFEYWMAEKEIPRTLECWQGGAAALTMEKEIELAHASINYTLLVSPVLVSGHPAFVDFVSFVSRRMFTEPKIQCLIEASSVVALKYLGQSRSVVKCDEDRVLISVCSKFSFTATASLLGGQIWCLANMTGRENSVAMEVKREFNITNISKPCQTEVVLDSSRYWKVGDTRRITVTSRNCSIWNVSHSCRLLLADAASSVALRKVQQGSFSSAHELQVSRSMALQNWSVRCSVNQSGVMHDEAESLEELQPLIFYPANVRVRAITENSQVFLAVTGSDCRPSVSSAICLISNSSAGNDNIQLNISKTSEKWSFKGTVPAPLCTASSTNESSVEVNCTVQQDFNGSQIFQGMSETSVDCDPTQTDPPGFETEASDDSQDSSGKLTVAVIAFSVLTALILIAAAAVLLILKRTQLNELIYSALPASLETSTHSQPVDHPLSRVPETRESRPSGMSSRSQSAQLAARHLHGVNRFISVVSLHTLQQSSSDEESADDADSEDPLLGEEFTEAIGHYDSDGSTFVPYDGLRSRQSDGKSE